MIKTKKLPYKELPYSAFKTILGEIKHACGYLDLFKPTAEQGEELLNAVGKLHFKLVALRRTPERSQEVKEARTKTTQNARDSRKYFYQNEYGEVVYITERERNANPYLKEHSKRVYKGNDKLLADLIEQSKLHHKEAEVVAEAGGWA